MNIRELTKEQLAEESFIDLAYATLNERKTPIAFKDLLKEIQTLLGLSDEEIQEKLVQFYTDMNIDGRFLVNQENAWGLREWYKIETIEEETAPTVKARKRKSKASAVDEEELIDEDDLVFEEDLEEFVEEDAEEDEEEEDIEFVDEELDIDSEIDDVDVDDEIIEEDDEFIIEDDELEIDEEDEEDEK